MRSTLSKDKQVLQRDGADESSIFDTGHLVSNLKERSVRGGVITVVERGAKFALQLGCTVVLARILTPGDYGLVAMVTAITGFVEVFKDLGLSMATIQKAEVNHKQISTLFWINVALGFVIMALIAAISPLIAWFYGNFSLIPITLALSTAFIFGGLAVQHQALLRRQMRFGILAVIEIVSVSAGISAAIVSALQGARHWALVLMPLVSAITTTAGVWLACRWWPGSPFNRSGVGSMLTFGWNLTGFNIINYFARSLDKILIGKSAGPAQLGLYSRAYRLMLMPIQQVSAPLATVAIPALSRLQDEPEKFRRYYLKAISFIAFITMPLVMYMVVMSKETIMLILGEQWIGASRIFAVLAVSALIQPIYNTQGWLHISIGRSDRQFRWGLVGSAAIITSFFIGLPFGAIGMASCYTVVTYLILGPCLCYAGAPIGLKAGMILSAIWRIFVSAVCAGVICKYSLEAMGVDSLPMRIWAGLFLLSGIYLSLIAVLYQGLEPLRQLVGVLRCMPRTKPEAGN